MENKEHELTPEELEAVERIEGDRDALAATFDDLKSRSRRRRQLAARAIALLSGREPELLAEYIPDMVDALEQPEAQTRWEVLDALTELVPDHAREVGAAYEGAEDALFDEVSATLRLSAFRFLATWGATERGRSKKVWPVIDEAIQCYHGDMEYRDMLGCLYEFANGKIEGGIAAELAGRIHFDAENGKGAYLKARSSEIYELLVKRFKLESPQKRPRTSAKSEDSAED